MFNQFNGNPPANLEVPENTKSLKGIEVLEEFCEKVTQVLLRKDGSEVRITVSLGNGPLVDRRENTESTWKRCGDPPHPDWLNMPVADYQRFGRAEIFRVVSKMEIMLLSSMLGKPMSSLNVSSVELQAVSYFQCNAAAQ